MAALAERMAAEEEELQNAKDAKAAEEVAATAIYNPSPNPNPNLNLNPQANPNPNPTP